MKMKMYYYIKNVDTGRYEDVTSDRRIAYQLAAIRNRTVHQKRYRVCPRMSRPEFSK